MSTLEAPAKIEEAGMKPNRFLRAFGRYWENDRWYPLSLIGFLLAAVAFHRLDAPSGQRWSDFVQKNSRLLALMGVGLLLYVIGETGRVGRTRPVGGYVAGRKKISRRGWWIRKGLGSLAIAAGMSGYAYSIWHAYKSPFGLDGPAAMLAGIISLAVGLGLMEIRRRSLSGDLGLKIIPKGTPIHRGDGPWLALALFIWICLQVYHLETRPGFFSDDAAVVVTYGRDTYAPNTGQTLRSPWNVIFEPFLDCIPHALAFELFPTHPYLGPRLVSVASSATLLATFFLFARANFGRIAAWITFSFLGSNHIFLAFARSGLTNLDALLMTGLWAWSWTAAWRARRASLGWVAGASVGLAVYMYPGAMMLFPLCLLSAADQFWRNPREFLRRKWVMSALIVGCALTSAPHFIYLRNNMWDANHRANEVFILMRENLEYAFKETETKDVFSMLIARAWPAIGGALLWHHSSMPWDYASNAMPITDHDTAGLFVLGLVGALFLWRRRLVPVTILYWWGVAIIFGSLLTTSAPYAPRLTLTLGAGYLLAGGVIGGLIERARRLGGRWLAIPLLVAAILGSGTIAFRNMRHYYQYANDLKNEGYIRMGVGFMEFLRTVPRDVPLVYYGWGHAQFMLIDRKTSIQYHEATDPIPSPDPAQPRTAYVFQIPQFTEVEAQFQKAHPDLKSVDVLNPYRPELPPTHHVYWIERAEPEKSQP